MKFGTSICPEVFAAVGRNRRCTRDISDANRNVKIGFVTTPRRDDAMTLQTPSHSSERFLGDFFLRAAPVRRRLGPEIRRVTWDIMPMDVVKCRRIGEGCELIYR